MNITPRRTSHLSILFSSSLALRCESFAHQKNPLLRLDLDRLLIVKHLNSISAHPDLRYLNPNPQRTDNTITMAFRERFSVLADPESLCDSGSWTPINKTREPLLLRSQPHNNARLRRTKPATNELRKRDILRNVAAQIMHPRRTRRAKRATMQENAVFEEAQRIAMIEDFLESGRGGPRRRFDLD